MQKYNPDGTVASSWHPHWDTAAKRPLLPIQEDETALVLWALWQHYDKYRDIDFAHRCYRRLVVRAADFLASYRAETTGLPKPSWNLWEDRRGVHTFTCASVVAGLRAGADFARVFDESQNVEKYSAAADQIADAMRTQLYSEEHGRFLRGLLANGDDALTPDATIDASMCAIPYLGCFDVDDPMVTNTMAAIEKTLTNAGEIGGLARFENDGYMRVSESITGNSWIITTLWLAAYYIEAAKTEKDLNKALAILEWVTKRALPSGVLPEQIDPLTGDAVSVSPLTWSHSSFVATVHSYLRKRKTLLG